MSDTSRDAQLSPVKRALIDLRALARARRGARGARARADRHRRHERARSPGGVTDVAELRRPALVRRRCHLGDPRQSVADRGVVRRVAGHAGQDVHAPRRVSRGRLRVRCGVLRHRARRGREHGSPAAAGCSSSSWEALEHAGIAPSSLAGNAGRRVPGYRQRRLRAGALLSNPALIDPYFSPGNAYSVAAGRIAYVLGLHGPAIAIDTACSSSLVALHLACQGLRHGDCDLALAGGVNLILSPELNVNFCKAAMMSRDGRCRTFDAGANGYVRGEGGGFIVLRRLARRGGARRSDPRRGPRHRDQPGRPQQRPDGAERAGAAGGDPRRARRRGDASVAPGRLRRGAWHRHPARRPDRGRRAGRGALGRAATPDLAVALGSVKTNIGHLEAAAGICRRDQDGDRARAPRDPAAPALADAEPVHRLEGAADHDSRAPSIAMVRDRGAGMSPASARSASAARTRTSILEAAPCTDRSAKAHGSARAEQVLALSARDPQALHDLGRRYHTLLVTTWPDGPEASPRDICATANTGRTHFAHRVSVDRRLRSRGLRMRSATGCKARTTRASCAAPPDRAAQRRAWRFCFQGRARSTPAWGGSSTTAPRRFARRSTSAPPRSSRCWAVPLGAIVFPDEARRFRPIDQTTVRAAGDVRDRVRARGAVALLGRRAGCRHGPQLRRVRGGVRRRPAVARRCRAAWSSRGVGLARERRATG